MSIGYGYGNPKTGGLSRLRQRLRPSSFSDARCTWMIRIAGNSPHPRSCPALLRTGLVSACLLWWPHHKRQAFARCARLQDLGSVYTNAGLPASAHALPSWFPRPRNAETTRGDEGKERVDGAERPSTLVRVWSIQLPVASIPLSVNEGSEIRIRGTLHPRSHRQLH